MSEDRSTFTDEALKAYRDESLTPAERRAALAAAAQRWQATLERDRWT